MGSNTKIAYSLVFLALLLGGTYYLVRTNEAKGEPTDPVERTLAYANPVYGYAFEYAPGLALVEFIPEYQTIEDQSRAEPNELVHISVEELDLDDVQLEEYESAEDFAKARAVNYCAADGPGGSMRCTQVTRAENFTTATGLTGEVFYLAFVHETFASGDTPASTTTREAGPFYAFNISTDAPGSGYRVLIFRPAPFFEEGEWADTSARVTNEVVNSLTL